MVKGFKKDGKFRPTGNRTSKTLSVKQILGSFPKKDVERDIQGGIEEILRLKKGTITKTKLIDIEGFDLPKVDFSKKASILDTEIKILNKKGIRVSAITPQKNSVKVFATLDVNKFRRTFGGEPFRPDIRKALTGEQ